MFVAWLSVYQWALRARETASDTNSYGRPVREYVLTRFASSVFAMIATATFSRGAMRFTLARALPESDAQSDPTTNVRRVGRARIRAYRFPWTTPFGDYVPETIICATRKLGETIA